MSWIIAHRGDHRDHIENTLGAFERAYTRENTFVELDVQLTCDLVPVIFHDDKLERFTHLVNEVREFNHAQIKTLELQEGTKDSAKIPTLDNFLKKFPNLPVYFELKVPQSKQNCLPYLNDLAAKTLEVLEQHPVHQDSFLASFHPKMGHILQSLNSSFKYTQIFEDKKLFEDSFNWAPQAPRFSEQLKDQSWDFISISWKSVWRRLENPNILDQSLIFIWGIENEDFISQKQGQFKGLVSDTYFL